MNHDGKLDLLIANYGNSTVGVLLGTGTGSFGGLATYSTGAGSFPYGLAVADVNGDGHPDVLTANIRTNSVAVLLGTGTGSFGNWVAYGTGADSWPNNVMAADVNNDGRLDLLTANTFNSTVGVLLGTGMGSFGPVTTYSTGALSSPFSLAVADMNGDGQLDVLTANASTNAVGVLLGTGTGSFGAAAAYDTGAGTRPYCLALADMNGDGRPDVLTANVSTSTVSLLLSGAGSFGAAIAYSAGQSSYPQSIVVADVNGDGRPDILTTNSGSNTVGILLNTTALLPTRAALPGTTATLYPNPARTAATLTLAGLPAAATHTQATLLDAVGRVTGHYTLAATGGSLPLAGLAPGLYVVRLAALDASGQVLGALPAQRLSVE